MGVQRRRGNRAYGSGARQKPRHAGDGGRHRDQGIVAIYRGRWLRQGQGYLFAKPVPLAKLPDAVRAAAQLTLDDEPNMHAGVQMASRYA